MADLIDQMTGLWEGMEDLLEYMQHVDVPHPQLGRGGYG